MNKKPQTTQQILILGAGFAGLRAATDLVARLGHRQDIEVIVIDKEDHQAFHARLYELIAEALPRRAVRLSHQQILKETQVRLVQDRVIKIDPIKQVVKLHNYGQLRYDYLVIALGAQNNFHSIPGAQEFSLPLQSVGQAMQIRDQLQTLYKRQTEVKVAIVGGGLTGVELAAALAHYEPALRDHYSRDQHRFEINLIEAGPQILNGLQEKTRRFVTGWLNHHQVQLFLGHPIKQVKSRQLVLSSGQTVEYDCLIWAAGFKGLTLLEKSGLATDPSGRIIVNAKLQAKGFARIFVAGDAAHYAVTHNNCLPMSATHAIYQGSCIAHNIAAAIHHQKLVAYDIQKFPIILPLGERTGVLEWGQWRLTGRLALKIKLMLEFYYLAGYLPLRLAWKLTFATHHR